MILLYEFTLFYEGKWGEEKKKNPQVSIKIFSLCFQLTQDYLVLCSVFSEEWRCYLKTILHIMLTSTTMGRSSHLPKVQCQMDGYKWMDTRICLSTSFSNHIYICIYTDIYWSTYIFKTWRMIVLLTLNVYVFISIQSYPLAVF